MSTDSASRAGRSAAMHVVKVGGAHLADEDYLAALVSRVRSLVDSGAQVVLVHGGGCEIAALHDALGVPFRKERGLRVTSERSMSLVTMVLRGLVNTRLTARFVAAGVPTIGVSGVDVGLMRARFLNYAQLGRVGGAPAVDTAALERVLGVAALVVLAPVCLGSDGRPVNVNADAVAQALAVALGAETLELITDVDAVRDHHGAAHELSASRVEQLIGDEVIAGGMIPKAQAALAAVDGGVQRVRVGSLSSLARGEATEVHA